MNPEQFFKQMYRDIWQSEAVEKIEAYYSTDFQETIDLADENKQRKTIHMNFNDLRNNALFQKEHYQYTTFEIIKLVSNENTISVNFYSSSIVKETGELRHRCVCGIWHLNAAGKIDRVWAVVAP